MTRKQFQTQINKAQSFKEKAYNQSEAIENGYISNNKRNHDISNRASESYEKIYQALVKVAKENKWLITEFETNDFFDYETFDYE